MGAIFLALFITLNNPVIEKHNCECKQASANELTRTGGNEQVTIIERKVFKIIHGTIETYSNSQIETLIEVFDNPEHLRLNYPESVTQRKPQKRIAACKSGKDGSFCFDEIPPGKYELRLSIGPEWNVTSVYIVVNPRNKNSTGEKLSVPMKLGT